MSGAVGKMLMKLFAPLLAKLGGFAGMLIRPVLIMLAESIIKKIADLYEEKVAKPKRAEAERLRKEKMDKVMADLEQAQKDGNEEAQRDALSSIVDDYNRK